MRYSSITWRNGDLDAEAALQLQGELSESQRIQAELEPGRRGFEVAHVDAGDLFDQLAKLPSNWRAGRAASADGEAGTGKSIFSPTTLASAANRRARQWRLLPARRPSIADAGMDNRAERSAGAVHEMRNALQSTATPRVHTLPTDAARASHSRSAASPRHGSATGPICASLHRPSPVVPASTTWRAGRSRSADAGDRRAARQPPARIAPADADARAQ